MKFKKNQHQLKKKEKSGKLIMKGTILERLRDREYRIELENGLVIVGKKINKFRVSTNKIVMGDRVIIEIPTSQTTIERGDIVGFA